MFNFCLFVNKARKSASKQARKNARNETLCPITSDVRDSSEDDVEAGDDGGEVLEFDSDHNLGIHSEDALEGNDSLGLCINISFLFCIL